MANDRKGKNGNKCRKVKCYVFLQAEHFFIYIIIYSCLRESRGPTEKVELGDGYVICHS